MPLGFHHVGNCDQRKIQSVRFTRIRIDGRRSGTAFATADHIRTNHKIKICIQCFARADQIVPPAGSFIIFLYCLDEEGGNGDRHGSGKSAASEPIPISVRRDVIGLFNWDRKLGGFDLPVERLGLAPACGTPRSTSGPARWSRRSATA